MCGTEHPAASVNKRSPFPETTEKTKKKLPSDSVINLDHGDPRMFEEYWKKMGDKCTITISGYQSLSYFSDSKTICWFMEPELTDEIKRLHNVVGNAVTDDRQIIVGTGSSQLFQAALYALSSPDAPKPLNVVSAVPYYSSYPTITDFLKSGLYKWAGDASTYNEEDPYIELVCSPSNPDGFIRKPVVNREGEGAHLVHDLAYYWPQYTAITAPADHDLMLFTLSKVTGHAGNRIGWAIVKDLEVAKKMTKFIELNTIGVSKSSQLRAAKILRTVSESCETSSYGDVGNFFEFGRHCLTQRWERLRAAIKLNGHFSLPEYPTEFCNFSGEFTEAHPAFAWLKSTSKEIEDCASLFKDHKILTRGGKFFGVENRFVRVSMLDSEESFDLFMDRISSLLSENVVKSA